ncbi:hypothetical protein DFH07DRAFT_779936 [Mycena maculata]|uniref:Uncharacterized protein n=1 Tax=Mycena maculata TaxID=230809 RepID=A0AAD7I791_9AGAR|nr:hypothetical protein DFH07DRAFT_779936 [Mycena maculata]
MPPKKRTRTKASTATTEPSSTTAVLHAGSSGSTRPSQNSSAGLLAMPVELLHLTATRWGSCLGAGISLSLGQSPRLIPDISPSPPHLSAHALRMPGHGAAFYKYLGDFLKRTSEGLAREPRLLACIRTVNVVLTRYSSAEVLPPFARCLSQMPNLHSLQIIHAHTKMTTHLKNGFAGCSIPSVRKIILPSWAHEVLRCCPEVTHVICTGGDSSNLVSAIAKSCKKVEIIEGFILSDDRIMKRAPQSYSALCRILTSCPGLLKAAPDLKKVKLVHFAEKETIAGLAAFKKLTAITLTHRITQDQREQGTYASTHSQELDQCIDVARRVLRKQTAGPPRFAICYVVPAFIFRGQERQGSTLEEQIPV